MLYVLLVMAAAVAAVRVGRRSPRTLTIVGVVAVALGLVAVGIGELSGNVLLFFVGGMSAFFGVLVLLGCLVDALARERGTTRFLP